MVRKGGLEPPRSCDRQPLKLVRLPIPPLPHKREFSVICSHSSVVLPQPSIPNRVLQGPLLKTDGCSSYFFAGAGVTGDTGVDWKGTVMGGSAFGGADAGAVRGADFTGACSSTEPEEDLDA